MMVTDFECIDGAVECSTLTTDQATGVLRYAGVKISPVTLREGIEQGRFPFGFVIDGKTRLFMISRHKLEEWIEDFTGVQVSVERILEGYKKLNT